MTGECEIARKPSEERLGMKQLRKRHKPWHYALSPQENHSAQVSQEKKDSEDATSAKWRTESSERVFSDSQEKLKKILGTRKFRNLKEKYNFQDSDDSDKEEEKSIKKEDLKERPGYKLTIEALRATLVKPVS